MLFALGLAFLLTHELDAVRCEEWRILPGFSYLDEPPAKMLFLLLHVPVFVWILYALATGGLKSGFARGFDVFMIVHVGLHVLLLWHPRNEFKDWMSWASIGGAGVCAALDLLLMS